jgi:hypothetical protein
LQCGTLMRAKATHPATRRDTDLFHDSLRPNFPDAGHRFEYRADPHLANRLDGLAGGEDILERGAGMLESVAKLCPRLPGGRRLLERGGPLFRSQWRENHRNAHLRSCGRGRGENADT